MDQSTEQLIALNKAASEAAGRLAGVALAGAERMLEVQLEAAKSAFGDYVHQARVLAETRDVSDLARRSEVFAQPNLQKATDYVKDILDVAAKTQAELGRLVEAHVLECNRYCMVSLDQWVKATPAGSEVAATAVKSALSAVDLAYANFAQAAKQTAVTTQQATETAAKQITGKGEKRAA